MLAILILTDTCFEFEIPLHICKLHSTNFPNTTTTNIKACSIRRLNHQKHNPNMNLFPLNSETIKLYNFQVNLEKSISPIIERLKKCTELDLYELSNDLEKRRQSEWSTLQTRMRDIFKPLNSKIILIKNKDIGNITDFKQFKKEMILIQDNIQNLKYCNKKQLELLEKELTDLTDDVNYYNEKMLEWTEPVQINFYHISNLEKHKGIQSRHQCKEVKEFMDFVHASAGHENGWRKEDHHLFIKFRKKYKHIDTISKYLHEEFPDISIEEIKHHEEWYQKYIKLEMKKRTALKNWQKEKANKSTTRKYSDVPSKIATIMQPSVNIQEKLKKWKAQKEEQTKNAKQIEVYKKQKQIEIEQLQKKRNDELKTLVQEWKQKRQDMEEQDVVQKRITAEQEKKRRALEANRLIKQFQSQDDLYIMRMKQKKKPEPFPTIRRSKSSHSAKRDPKRLLKPTQQWINRVHDENPPENFGKVMPLRCLPKLAIPEWRRKLE